MFSYLLQFILGGGIIVGMVFLAKIYGGKTAAVLYAIPVQFTLTVIFIYLEDSAKTVRDLSIGTLYSLLILAIFISAFYFLSLCFEFWTALLCSYLLFFLCCYIYLFYIANN